MKLLLEGWRQYLTEEKNKLNSEFEEWHSEVSANLKKDGYDPREFEKKAERAYNNGYTASEFEEEWLDKQGLLEQEGGQRRLTK
tara:strand:- start:90 stop:341 length:252 start_codon:yes stop_codon:yes gene_type:complete